MKEQFSIMKAVLVWVVFAALVVFALYWVGLFSLPAWLKLERTAFTNSHQYVESKRTEIANYVAECEPLPEGPQRQALRQRIAAEVTLLPADVYIDTRRC